LILLQQKDDDRIYSRRVPKSSIQDDGSKVIFQILGFSLPIRPKKGVESAISLHWRSQNKRKKINDLPEQRAC
jgi:hypothetical protein